MEFRRKQEVQEDWLEAIEVDEEKRLCVMVPVTRIQQMKQYCSNYNITQREFFIKCVDRMVEESIEQDSYKYVGKF